MSNYQSSEQQDYIKQLTGEYGKSYIKCATYIRNLNYGLIHETNCLIQILDDFMTAQKEGRPIERITGKSLIDYCDNIVKAELERMGNRYLYRFQSFFGMLFLFLLLIFFNNTVFMPEKFEFHDIAKLRLNGLEMVFILSILTILLSRTIFSKLLFHHEKISRIIRSIIYFAIIGVFSGIFNSGKINDSRFLFALDIPLPVYIILVIIAILGLAICHIIQKNYPAFQTVTLEEPLEEPDPVKCPVCSKEHDFDYPKCPYCGHEYIF